MSETKTEAAAGGSASGGAGSRAGTVDHAGQSPQEPGAGVGQSGQPSSSKGPIDGQKERAGNFGQGSDEHEALRRAENAFGGDQVLGDKLLVHVYGTQRPVAPRELSDEVKDSVKHAFVPPTGWDELRERTQRHCVLIVRASPGEGRTASALRLLGSRRHDHVYELEPGVDLDRLADSLQEHADSPRQPSSAPGYVLSDPQEEARLSARMVRGLDSVLRRTGASLIVTVGPEASIEQDLLEFVVDLPAAPPKFAILRAHLHWRLVDTPLLADQQLERKDIAEFVASVIGIATTCSDAAALATIMWEELDGAEDELDRVRVRYAKRSNNELDTWFGGLPDLETRTFAIALAVFNGLPYEEVTRAARRLLLRLERQARPERNPGQAIIPPADSRRHDPFGVSRQARLQRLRARVVDERGSGPDAPPPSMNVSYLEVGRAEQVLARAWTDYEIQDELLEWLLDLIDNPSSQQMLYHVSRALGFLATKSFGYLQSRFLNSWSVSDTALHRDVVAFSLRETAHRPYMHADVERFTDQLFRNSTGWQGRATAARIYGVGLGLSDPQTALAKLDRLALVNDANTDEGRAIEDSIAKSFVIMILDHRDNLYSQVLEILLRWNEDLRRRDTAHLVFLDVAVRIVRTVPGADENRLDKVAVWPELLYKAQNDFEVRGPLLSMWREAMNGRRRSYATAVMRDWAQAAELDAAVRSAFSRLLRALASGDAGGTAKILLGYADDWSDDDQLVPLPRVARAVREALLVDAPGAAAEFLVSTTTMPVPVV